MLVDLELVCLKTLVDQESQQSQHSLLLLLQYNKCRWRRQSERKLLMLVMAPQGSPSSIVGPNITTITSTGGGAGANLDSTPNNGGGGGSGGGAAHGNQLVKQEDLQLLLQFKDMLEEITQVHIHLHTLEQVAVALVVLAVMLPPGLWGDGGNGKRTTIAGPQYGVGTPGPGGTGGYLAGGGGGGGNSSFGSAPPSPPNGGYGGGGEGKKDGTGGYGLAGTGGGGGGGSWNGPVEGGKGGSGLVVLRYQIAELGASLKATGVMSVSMAANNSHLHKFRSLCKH